MKHLRVKPIEIPLKYGLMTIKKRREGVKPKEIAEKSLLI